MEPTPPLFATAQLFFDTVHFTIPFFRQYGFSEDIFSAVVQKTPDAKFLMLKVYSELAVSDPFTATSIHMLLLGFLEQAKHWCSDNKIPGGINTVHGLLHDRWGENLSLEDLAAIADVHHGTISHYFPKYFS